MFHITRSPEIFHFWGWLSQWLDIIIRDPYSVFLLRHLQCVEFLFWLASILLQDGCYSFWHYMLTTISWDRKGNCFPPVCLLISEKKPRSSKAGFPSHAIRQCWSHSYAYTKSLSREMRRRHWFRWTSNDLPSESGKGPGLHHMQDHCHWTKTGLC